MSGKVVAVSISEKKGEKKRNVPSVELREEYGIIGDAHAGGERQVSLLAAESIETMKKKGLSVGAGDFAENITTGQIELINLDRGAKLKIGETVLLEITQIG
ncbi:MAG: MOSC domain-containing protein, partial [Candidatus Omnitrophota bacterium]